MKIRSTKFGGKVGGSGSGYELEILQGRAKPRGFIGLKGGLGDAGSDSFYGFAQRLIEKSDGEYAAGLIGTTRPTNLLMVLRGNPELARRRRSQSVYGAIRHAIGWLEPEEVLLGGQSQGGISIVDGVAHAIKQKANTLPENTQVITYDTPSLRGPIEQQAGAVESLARLGLHCAVDVPRMPVSTLHKMATGSLFKRSSFEPIYFTREAQYLLDDLDVSPEVAFVREQYDLHEVYHRHDLVPGAEHEGQPHVTVFDGGHVEMFTIDGMEPVIDYTLGLSRLS